MVPARNENITATSLGATINAGAGGDTVTINAGLTTTRSWTVDLGSDSTTDKIVFTHAALGIGDNTVATVSNFIVANDKVAVMLGAAAVADGNFQPVTVGNTNISAGTEVVELAINNASFVTTSLTDDANGGEIIDDIIVAATNGIATGTYTFIVYSSTNVSTANAGNCTVDITDNTNPESGGITVEHIMTLNGVGFGNLADANFVAAVDPLVLDLGASGIHFSSLADGVHFDINADGISDQLAWTAGEDGILAYDMDGSGLIENGSELFTPYFAGGKFADGLAALASLNINGDSVIDGADSGLL